MKCAACGAELDPRDKFCSECGALTPRSLGAMTLAKRATVAFFQTASKLVSVAFVYVIDPGNRIRVWVSSAVLAVLLITLTDNPLSRSVGNAFSSSPDAPSLNEDGAPDFVAYEDVFIGDRTEYYVASDANIRDYPTSEGSQIIGAYSQGDTFSAREVMGLEPESKWVKLDSGGYVWAGHVEFTLPDLFPSSDHLPDNLLGAWSDYAHCIGSGPSTTIVMEEDGFDFGAVRYEYTGPSTLARGYPSHDFSVVSGEQEDSSVVMWASSDLSQIWIRFGDFPGEDERFYLPGSKSCDWATPRVREIRADN